jgi:uncharacterized repeat protein (TIGR02543 family)
VGNEQVAVEAVADEHYHFAHWSGTAVDQGKVTSALDPETTVTVDGDYTLTANFELDNYTLTISSVGGGSVTMPGEGTFTYERGTSVEVEATAKEGYYFAGWTGTAVDDGKVADPTKAGTTVLVDGDYTLEAHFTFENHTLSVSSTAGGSVTTPGEGEFTYGGNLLGSLVATPDEHYHFTHWSGSAVDAFKVGHWDNASTSVLVDGDYTVMANFAIDTHTLTTSSTAGGSVTTPGEETKTYDYGEVVSLIATAEAGYHFVSWTGPVADPESASTTVTITGDLSVEAVFEIDQDPPAK